MIQFNSDFNNSMSIGIELELMIIEREKLIPIQNTDFFFDSLDKKYNKIFQKEYFTHMVEIVSPVFNKINEIELFFNQTLDYLKNISYKYNINFYAAGTNPLLFQNNVSVSKDKRYNILKNELQSILNRFLIMGLHIHVGMKSKSHLINCLNKINYLLPLFLSMSISSPFFEGKNTGILSYRNMILDSLPRSGVSEYISEYIYDYENFINLISNLYNNSIIKSINDIWWDVRPRPDLGTLELRICDSINDIKRIQAIAAFLQAICLDSFENKQPFFYHQIAKQNKWNCVRYAKNGKFIDFNEVLTIEKKAYSVLDEMIAKDIFLELETEEYIELIKKYLSEISIAEQMIKIYKQTGSITNVISKGMLFNERNHFGWR